MEPAVEAQPMDVGAGEQAADAQAGPQQNTLYVNNLYGEGAGKSTR